MFHQPIILQWKWSNIKHTLYATRILAESLHVWTYTLFDYLCDLKNVENGISYVTRREDVRYTKRLSKKNYCLQASAKFLDICGTTTPWFDRNHRFRPTSATFSHFQKTILQMSFLLPFHSVCSFSVRQILILLADVHQ